MTVLLVAAGGAVGAVLRYLADLWLTRHANFPLGTLTVNVLGSALLGLLTGLVVSAPVNAALAVGLCGSLTTYSTFGYETVRLFTEPRRRAAVLYAGVTILAGLTAAGLGLLAGSGF